MFREIPEQVQRNRTRHKCILIKLVKKKQEEKVDRTTRNITPIFNVAVVKELISKFSTCDTTEDNSIKRHSQNLRSNRRAVRCNSG